MEVGTQAMDHLINILQTDRYVNTHTCNACGLQLSKHANVCLPNATDLTLKSSAMLWIRFTMSSAMMRRKNKVLHPTSLKKCVI